MAKLRVSIVGGSGYTGGELLRLLLAHPEVEVVQVTSERLASKFVHRVHPNLRRKTQLQFSPLSELREVDLLFLCLPHGGAMRRIADFMKLAPKVIDLSADFRLQDQIAYRKWYGVEHPAPDLLSSFVYGIPELHRQEMRSAQFVSSAGCNATATILALYPLVKAGLVLKGNVVVEVKAGSSEAGAEGNDGSHHPVRANCVRSFMPTGHRHTAEVYQELALSSELAVHMSATAIDMVRGILATSHVFLDRSVTEKQIWQCYREYYGEEPFIRLVKEAQGNYRYPEPKLLWGTNYCDIGFELDPDSGRLVVISAIDNLMKGAAGQAVQAMNIMSGYPETSALEFSGLHPI